MEEQLSFDLPVRTALGREDFFLSPANALAVTALDGDWPDGKLALIGPAGSGKTHLAHVWAVDSGAVIVPATGLSERDLPALAEGPVAVEDVPRIAGHRDDETALFHLHNMLAANGNRLLISGRTVPRRWALVLPDLQSRCEGATVASLDPPDDALLAAVLQKLFRDRQIMPKGAVIPYLVRHMERTFEAAARIVARMDQIALDKARGVTVKLASEVLAEEANGAA